MGACETTPPATRAGEPAQRPPHTAPIPGTALPRFRSSAAACRPQARSSSPAPDSAALRALQLDPSPHDGPNRQQRGKAPQQQSHPNPAVGDRVTGSIQHGPLTGGVPMGANIAMGQDLRRVEYSWFSQVRTMGVQVGFRSRNDNTTAPAVDHLMIPSAAIIEHHQRAARTPRPGCIGHLVQSSRAIKCRAVDLPRASNLGLGARSTSLIWQALSLPRLACLDAAGYRLCECSGARFPSGRLSPGGSELAGDRLGSHQAWR
jgi:hypothetical protein